MKKTICSLLLLLVSAAANAGGNPFCYIIKDPNKCMSTPTCLWKQPKCSTDPDAPYGGNQFCYIIKDQNKCLSTPTCEWTVGKCYTDPDA